MRKIYLSLFVMMLTVVMTAAPVAAFFTASATVHNNTFSTGTLDLRLFYDCIREEEQVYHGDNSIVECPENVGGVEERLGALKYHNTVDGATYNPDGSIYNNEGDWTQANGWWGGLSSAIDHTFVFPGWSASTPPWQDSDLLSVGNSGDLPLDLSMTLAFEARNVLERFEPLDGLAPGGDKIDPYTDRDWRVLEGRTYDTDLAEAIMLEWERVDHTGAVVGGHTGTATLASIIAGGALDLGSLAPDEVAYVRFNWWMPETDEPQDEYQGLVFDYSITFDAVQAPVASPAP